MSETFTFKTGDKVVYPSHGVGEITGEEVQEVAGSEMKLYVISFEQDKMVLRVPVQRVEASGLRALSQDNDVDEAVRLLKGKAKPGRGMWSRRAQEYEAKINSGDVIAIAEVVRDLHKNVDDPDRSYSERVIYEAALGRLAGEYAAVKTVTQDEASEFLVKVLKSRRSSTKVAANDDESDVAA
jgi:CarD family transcriptional regulator